jgi:hypothetical protein
MKHDEQAEIRKFIRKHQLENLQGNDQLKALLHAVAAIPWGEGRTVSEVLATRGVGTCTGKHLVLQACLEMLRIPYRTVVCTFQWGEQGVHLPEALFQLLQEGEWPHAHNFVQILIDGEYVDVDVTWDAGLANYGFAAFPENWDGKSPFVGVKNPGHRVEGVDIEAKKRTLLASLSPETRARRQQFLDGLIHWIEQLHTKDLAKSPASGLAR